MSLNNSDTNVRQEVINKHIFVWLFNFVLGVFGADRFLRGQIALGVIKLLTCGGCLVWWFVDWIISLVMVYGDNCRGSSYVYFENGKYLRSDDAIIYNETPNVSDNAAIDLEDENGKLKSSLFSAQQQIDALNGVVAGLKNENANLRRHLSPEQQEISVLNETLNTLKVDCNSLNSTKSKLTREIQTLASKVDKLKDEVVELDDEILFQTFGLYEPKFSFTTAERYKTELDKIRSEQKEMIKNKTAAVCNQNWRVNGSLSEGKKMANDLQTLLLRAFNSECDSVVDRVKYNNFDSSLKRVMKAYESVCKLGKIADIQISKEYLYLKQTELRLALEYAMKKEEEKEAIRAAKAEMREAAKVQAEIEEKRKASEKEKKHYMSALKDIDKRIRENPSEKLMKKREEIAAQLKHIKEESAQLDYREANAKAGYVYIISNIGAFGENVYKIGMTRRLDPQDRIDELSSASVPFKFDTHAMIFTKDAPALENALHKAFEANRVNLVNNRKEFYKVPLDRIKAVVRANYDDTVEFYDYADAKDYRESLKIREQMKVKR